MRLVYFTHSLDSCWNHGNAHFLRGILRELVRRGHEVRVVEPANGWSLGNLLADHGSEGLAPFRAAYPELRSHHLDPACDLAAEVDGADAVLVHEWNAPALVAELGRLRRRGGRFRLLFHDTHHRAVSDPAAMREFDLAQYDGVLAFGATLAAVYCGWGWGDRVFVWHEAADVSLFHPPAETFERRGLVWIGNWGDDERNAELEDYLLRPAAALGLPLEVHGVRYPDAAIAMLDCYGAQYRGWISNVRVPQIFARHLATVHVPRRFYAGALPGIPTIRVFEALAAGIPLVSAPWRDSEGLFRVGEDFLMARDPSEMEDCLRAVAHDPALRASLAAHGRETILARHSCAHRVDELLGILARLGAGAAAMEV